MKKLNLIVLISALAAVLLVAGCSNVFSPSLSQGDQNGNVTVSFSAATFGRTVLPSTLDFDVYEFTFTNENGAYEETFSMGKSPGGTFNFTVPPGSGYSLDVKAYKNGVAVPAAEGSSAGQFTVGTFHTDVTVRLRGNLSGGPDGDFSYFVKFPNGAAVDRFVLIGSEEIPLQNNAAENGVYSGRVEAPAGWYELEIILSSGEKIAFDYDIVRIYSDTTTFYGSETEPVVFLAKDFNYLSTDPDSPQQVTEWYGFIIPTVKDANDPNALPDAFYSGITGTSFPSIQFEDGKTYSDVLKLEPPDAYTFNQYMVGGVAMLYPTLENTTYSFRVKVWMEYGGDGEVRFQHGHSGISHPTIMETQTRGQWVTLQGSIDNAKNPVPGNVSLGDEIGEFVYMQGNYSNVNGMRYATVYLRDLVVFKSGEEIARSAPNDDPDDPVDPGNPDPDELWLSHTKLTMFPGDMRYVTPSPAYGISWVSANTSMVTVEGRGIGLTGSGNIGYIVAGNVTGTTTVTATGPGGISAEIVVEVKQKEEVAGKKYIVLTFDDGPGGNTAGVLDILDKYGAAGTFFLIGNNVDYAGGSLVRRMRDTGHDIGNHTLNHEWSSLYTFSYERLVQEIGDCQNAIERVTSADGKPYTPVYFRAPGGYYSPDYVRAAKYHGLPFIGACEITDDSPMPSGMNVPEYVRRFNAAARPWGIVTCHDNYGSSDYLAEALDLFIPAMQAQGYEFVTLSDMIALKGALHPEAGKIVEDVYDLEPDPDFDGSVLRVASVTVSPKSFVLAPGQTRQLTANVLPRIAANKNVSWASNNSGVAAVDAAGLVTAIAKGSAVITATTQDGGKTSTATVTVRSPDDVLTEWMDTDTFVLSGAEDKQWSFFGSKAVTEVCEEYEGHANVLKLSPPAGGYYYQHGVGGSLALTYLALQGGNYTVSMDVWVDSANVTPGKNVILTWQTSQDWDHLHFSPDGNSGFVGSIYDYVQTDTWISRTGTLNIQEGATIGLLAINWVAEHGLHNATIYIKNFKLELDGKTLIDISGSGAAVPTGSPGVTLNWDNSEFSMLEKSITISEGQTVTIAPQGSFDSYEWSLDRVIVGTGSTYQFTGTGKGTYKILLWVNGYSKGASIIVVVE